MYQLRFTVTQKLDAALLGTPRRVGMSVVYQPSQYNAKPLAAWKMSDVEAELMRVVRQFDTLFNETAPMEYMELAIEDTETGRVKYRSGITETGNPNYMAAAYASQLKNQGKVNVHE